MKDWCLRLKAICASEFTDTPVLLGVMAHSCSGFSEQSYLNSTQLLLAAPDCGADTDYAPTVPG